MKSIVKLSTQHKTSNMNLNKLINAYQRSRKEKNVKTLQREDMIRWLVVS